MACIKHWLIRKGGGHSAGRQQLRSAAYTLSILSHPMRLRIILRLCEGEQNVGQLRTTLSMNINTIRGYLTQLRQGGLVMVEHQGARSCYSLTELGSKIACFVEETFTVAGHR
jgi:DNA-binding transcriptional ArsR family regulator